MPTTLDNRGATGRGAISNPAGRFEAARIEPVDDGWDHTDIPPPLQTELRPETARRIITRNRSPDLPFDRSINPYRGCEHGCIYCYARPSHSFLNLSPGLDFETRLFYKDNAAALLEQELRRPGYRCAPIALGTNTDIYQPIEKRLRITRSLLKVLARYRHPVTLLTKSTLIERDIDLLAELAEQRLVSVMLSITTLDATLKRNMEPRAAAPAARLRTLARLNEAGIPCGVLIAPVIPVINEFELEAILAAAVAAGAGQAGYVLLRLPLELAGLFREWLATHYPDREAHVLSALRQMHGGKVYTARFGHRQRGAGAFARLLEHRFRLALRRHGLAQRNPDILDSTRFRVPPASGDQLQMQW